MPTIADIVKAAKRLSPKAFLKLRTALDRVEEQLWAQVLGRATVKHRKAKLTDAKIDELVLRRRYSGGRPRKPARPCLLRLTQTG
jgi:hypothetical protein